MSRRVVVTGIGFVAPGGIGQGAVWDNIRAGRGAIRRVTRFDPTGYPSALAGEVDGFNPTDFMPMRLARKLDPYTQYAVAASQLALDDGRMDLERVDRERMGVFVGNCFGGWDFTDRELRKLHTQGVKEVSPFQATSWFPAAPQGQISIHFGLRGFSKTVCGERASGHIGIALAARSIASGQCDVSLAGGAEAPITPFTYLACGTEGVLVGPDTPADGAYRPFDAGRRGLVPAEGAAFLLLEELTHALERRAPIYAEVLGFGLSNDACHPALLPPEERHLSVAMRKALEDADVTPDAISYVLADGLATPEGDRQEAAALRKVFGSERRVPVSVPRTMTGHLYGAAGALDAGLAALSIQHGEVPPTVGTRTVDASLDVSLVTETTTPERVDHVMLNGRGSGGLNASLIISRFARA
ncbi:beta-ketoacyl-[acyl-carrier-protein] synthase family protein [Pyxidicoccus fallax]|uniref:Beta-ketoacyl synthase beta n=1 Tax=Pyxidicoccus fallax TaxID=394095 RepID=A0A346D7B3_9BACT|nr:beta-ketoacyl-[acyl-carrier-protein] synthase family protein [Pyxidicoccus fallax]AXM42928.1 beta-ketoacyl synthase beta [Pyxidicoccus fallax]NMO18039.1 beta-ketoacyl-[acyl-carrier-protein] synthase family protein [Pyxidicoccus fallax]NPC78611.1 beta-ketoacyl-[acyl-carrier-protein] synthase family protein [Pyxidicoccus fallax]